MAWLLLSFASPGADLIIIFFTSIPFIITTTIFWMKATGERITVLKFYSTLVLLSFIIFRLIPDDWSCRFSSYQPSHEGVTVKECLLLSFISVCLFWIGTLGVRRSYSIFICLPLFIISMFLFVQAHHEIAFQGRCIEEKFFLITVRKVEHGWSLPKDINEATRTILREELYAESKKILDKRPENPNQNSVSLMYYYAPEDRRNLFFRCYELRGGKCFWVFKGFAGLFEIRSSEDVYAVLTPFEYWPNKVTLF